MTDRSRGAADGKARDAANAGARAAAHAKSRVPPSDARRRRELAAIHTGKRALGLNDGTYRDLLARVTGVRSAATLDRAGREKVIKELRRLGFTPAKARPGTIPASVYARAAELKLAGEKPQAALIAALWDELAARGALRAGKHASIESFMARIGIQVAHPRFLTPAQANRVIEALKAWLGRKEPAT